MTEFLNILVNNKENKLVMTEFLVMTESFDDFLHIKIIVYIDKEILNLCDSKTKRFTMP